MERSDPAARAERIERLLRERLRPEHLQVQDESERHRGHTGAASGGGHFRVTIVAGCFAGRSRLERHRLLHEVLEDELKAEIHALALRVFTPEEWARRGGAQERSEKSRH